jgi:DNA-directed RNA polymerase beta' subunit
VIRLKIADYNKLVDPYRIITDSEFYDRGQFTDGGLYSSRIFGPDNVPTAYICRCGRTSGAFKEGVVCKYCGTPVKFENLVNRTGWIDLGNNYYILHPMLYHQLNTLMGGTVLRSILKVHTRVTRDGHEFTEIDDDKPSRKRGRSGESNSRWKNIGMTNFYKHFTEIVTYYAHIGRRFPKKMSAYQVLLNNWEAIWTNKIPVPSKLLRPTVLRDGEMWSEEANRHFHSLMCKSTQLKNRREIMSQSIVDSNLYEIQMHLLEIYKKTFERIAHKDGFVRRDITGTRINFVTRSVIIPAPSTVRINEMWLPYLAFMEMWQGTIIYKLTQLHQIDYREALKRWYYGKVRASTDLFTIIDSIVNDGCYALLNRNPTINVGSILRMKITRVKRDIGDLSTSIPNNILSMMGADYDGDTLNIMPLFEPWLIEKTRPLDPRNLTMSRNMVGEINPELLPQRDALVGLNSY